MEQANYPASRKLPLERLVADALGAIDQLGYSRRSRNRYRAIWEHLIEFSDRKELGDEFSGDLGARFLEEYPAGNEEGKPCEGWRRHIVIGVKVLRTLLNTATSTVSSPTWKVSIFNQP